MELNIYTIIIILGVLMMITSAAVLIFCRIRKMKYGVESSKVLKRISGAVMAAGFLMVVFPYVLLFWCVATI